MEQLEQAVLQVVITAAAQVVQEVVFQVEDVMVVKAL
jgi:hypothetical protein